MRRFLICIIISFLFFSCRKNEEFVSNDAIINWTGNYEIDGCGFFVTVDGHLFKPDNENDISAEFKGSNINVIICYKETKDQVSDGCYTAEPTFTDRIHLKSIKNR